MKNVFARTVLALVLIPSFWMTSVGTAAAVWVDRPGETVGKMAACASQATGFIGEYECSNPIRVSFTVLGFYQACENVSRYPRELSLQAMLSAGYQPAQEGASFAKHKGAKLRGADLTGVYMKGAILCNTTMPDGSVIYSGC